MPSLISDPHVNIWTTSAPSPGPTNDMWQQAPNPPLSPKDKAERSRFPVPGINHEKLLSSPDFMLADERSIVQRDLVAGSTSDQKYYFPTQYDVRGPKKKRLGSRFLQITPNNITSTREYLTPYSLIVMILACVRPAFSRNNSLCETHSQMGPNNQSFEFYDMYFLQGDQSGMCLCVNSRGTLYVEDCASVLKDGRGECVFHVKPPQRDHPMTVIYSYEYPHSLKKCKSSDKRKIKACEKRWYVQIKSGGKVKTKRAKPSRPLNHTVTYMMRPQPRKDGSFHNKFDMATTPAPLVRHVPKGTQIFNLGKHRTRKKKPRKKNSEDPAAEVLPFNMLSSRGRPVRHRKSKTRKKGGLPFLLGHD